MPFGQAKHCARPAFGPQIVLAGYTGCMRQKRSPGSNLRAPARRRSAQRCEKDRGLGRGGMAAAGLLEPARE